MGAVEYQIYERNAQEELVSMFECTKKTSYTISSTGSALSYIVQPISYTAVCDNMYAEYSVNVE